MHELPIPELKINRIKVPGSQIKDQSFDILRLDQIHPEISGNKWFKLKFYLEEAGLSGKKTIISFGGPWSNHLLATAAACRLHGLESIGIVRGEEIIRPSALLVRAKSLGMQLVFISRNDYRLKKLPPGIESENSYLIPEGGYGKLGAKGAATILEFIPGGSYTHICCAVGTGTTIAGLIGAGHETVGISVMKNNLDLEQNIIALLPDPPGPFSLIHDYSFGGYAKYDSALIDFMNSFFESSAIPSDIVYTGKLFFAVNDLIDRGYFPLQSKILVIHSGGLAGNASLQTDTLFF